MASCKKRKLVDRVLNWDIPESLRKVIAYGNQLNGMIRLYEEKKLGITEKQYERLKKAYRIIENVMALREVGLDYVPHKREDFYLDKHKKISVLR